MSFQLAKSGENTVTLRSVPRTISGKYQCEVSADAPLFHTEASTAEMIVVEFPAHEPTLTVLNNGKHVIAIGELLKATCTSPPSFPPVNFTWTINNNIFPVRDKFPHFVHIPLLFSITQNSVGKLATVCCWCKRII